LNKKRKKKKLTAIYSVVFLVRTVTVGSTGYLPKTQDSPHLKGPVLISYYLLYSQRRKKRVQSALRIRAWKDISLPSGRCEGRLSPRAQSFPPHERILLSRYWRLLFIH